MDKRLNEVSQRIVASCCSQMGALTLTQEEADAIKDNIQRQVHSGMKRSPSFERSGVTWTKY
jgi:hypothetical protein